MFFSKSNNLNKKKYKAEYLDTSKIIINARNDKDAFDYAFIGEEIHGMLLALYALDANGKKQKPNEINLNTYIGGANMKKWYDEEYEWEIEVTGFLRSDKTENYCRNGEEIGDKYKCTYGCPVNENGQGICSKTMTVMFPIMEAVRSDGDLRNIGGSEEFCKDIVCPDGCVMFRMKAKKLGNENFFKGKYFNS